MIKDILNSAKNYFISIYIIFLDLYTDAFKPSENISIADKWLARVTVFIIILGIALILRLMICRILVR